MEPFDPTSRSEKVMGPLIGLGVIGALTYISVKEGTVGIWLALIAGTVIGGVCVYAIMKHRS